MNALESEIGNSLTALGFVNISFIFAIHASIINIVGWIALQSVDVCNGIGFEYVKDFTYFNSFMFIWFTLCAYILLFVYLNRFKYIGCISVAYSLMYFLFIMTFIPIYVVSILWGLVNLANGYCYNTKYHWATIIFVIMSIVGVLKTLFLFRNGSYVSVYF